MFGLSGVAFFKNIAKLKPLLLNSEVKENCGVGWGKSFINSKYQSSLKYKMHLEELGDFVL